MFIVKRMRQAPEKRGQVQWNQIINFILFQIATKNVHMRLLDVYCGNLSVFVAPYFYSKMTWKAWSIFHGNHNTEVIFLCKHGKFAK